MAIFKTENTRRWILARMWRNCTVWMRTQSDARLCEKYKRFSKNENWNYTWTSSPFPEYFSRRVEISIWKRFSSCAHCGSAHSCRGVEPPSCPSQVSQQRNCCPYAQWNTIYPFRKGKLCSQTFTLVSIVCFAHLIQESTLFLVALSSFSTCNKFWQVLFSFLLLQMSSNFPCYGILDIPII